jgi:hypothetical protein
MRHFLSGRLSRMIPTLPQQSTFMPNVGEMNPTQQQSAE